MSWFVGLSVVNTFHSVGVSGPLKSIRRPLDVIYFQTSISKVYFCKVCPAYASPKLCDFILSFQTLSHHLFLFSSSYFPLKECWQMRKFIVVMKSVPTWMKSAIKPWSSTITELDLHEIPAKKPGNLRGDTCDSFCRREKDEKCSDYTAAAAAGGGITYAGAATAEK